MRRAAVSPPRPGVRSGVRVGRALAAVVAACAVLVGASASAGATPREAPVEARVTVAPEPDGSAVSLDVTVYAPPSGSGRHPGVLLAHGLGGSKADLQGRAQRLADEGFVAVAYTARGFGASGGRVHLNDPAWEVADARRLVDMLAARPDVLLDGPGDPRVGVAGASYGGALALMLAASDPRVDADVAAITWHDLSTALYPQSAVAPGAPATPAGGAAPRGAPPGPFTQLWGAAFFTGAGASGGPGGDARCGRFDATVCSSLVGAMERGTPDARLLALLRRHSPAPLLARLSAPTLLVQGQTDSLFGLAQADATARALSAVGTTVAVRWTDGGHDAVSTTADADEDATIGWLRHYLVQAPGRRGAPLAGPGFTYTLPPARGDSGAEIVSADTYPGLGSGGPALGSAALPLRQATGRVLTPPGGQPGAVTTVPGLGARAANLPTYPLAALPGASLAVDSAPVDAATRMVGSPRVALTVTSTGDQVTLYASLWRLGSAPARVRPLVAPVRVAVTPGRPTRVEVALPPGTYDLPAGSTWRVLVTATDSAYANPRAARADEVTLARPSLWLPTVPAPPAPVVSIDTEASWLLAALGVCVLVLAATAWWRRRVRLSHHPRPDLADVPLVVEGLVKTYRDGHRAVDDVSWSAQRGQVVGLLGPNGAGKTTTMRMLLGLIRPDAGTVHVFGRPVDAGAAVLSRVGALVEGPGLLPHLSGRANLRAYWQATARPVDEAGFEQAEAVAALGGALDRPVRTYSQGMRQRLGIAQAMLGRPDVLFLDEPTNGLDPPQIAAMRTILKEYAATGRTVVVSSHLLAEVEQTCSHVVVMHAGRVVAAGAVADLLASDDTTALDLDPDADVPACVAALRRLPDLVSVEEAPPTVGRVGPRLVVHSALTRPQVVRAAVEAGVPVEGVSGHRHLEEVFLGYIAQAGEAGPAGVGVGDRLRQVRSR